MLQFIDGFPRGGWEATPLGSADFPRGGWEAPVAEVIDFPRGGWESSIAVVADALNTLAAVLTSGLPLA